MTDRDLDLRLLTARAVAREAGKLALDYFNRRAQLQVELKGMQDVVSVADRAVEDLVRARLSGTFPEDDLLGEEGGGAGRRAGAALWVIDPIDGTANFLRGMPYWSVALAYVKDDRVEIGVTYDPVHDELFWARRGGGAHRDHAPIRVSGATDPQRMVARRLKELYPWLPTPRVVESWSGWIALTTDQYPHVHQLAKGVWSGIGCNGRGLAAASLIGRDLAPSR